MQVNPTSQEQIDKADSDSKVSALATRMTPIQLFGDYVYFTTGGGKIPYSSIPYSTFIPCVCTVADAAAPCVMNIAKTGTDLDLLLPISLGYTGNLYIRVYGFGWN